MCITYHSITAKSAKSARFVCHVMFSVRCSSIEICVLFHRCCILAYLATIFIGSSFQMNWIYTLFSRSFHRSFVSFFFVDFFSSFVYRFVYRDVCTLHSMVMNTACRQLCSLFHNLSLSLPLCTTTLCVCERMCRYSVCRMYNTNKINQNETKWNERERKLRKNCFKCATTKNCCPWNSLHPEHFKVSRLNVEKKQKKLHCRRENMW